MSTHHAVMLMERGNCLLLCVVLLKGKSDLSHYASIRSMLWVIVYNRRMFLLRQIDKLLR